MALGASAAATSIIFVVFLNDFTGGKLSPAIVQFLPLLLIVVATVLNLSSVRSGGQAATSLTAVKVALVLFVGVGAFLLGDGSWSHFGQSGASGTCEGVPDSARLGVSGFGAAMLGALWGYNGWAVLAALGGEVRDPARTVPRALIGGTMLVIVLYMLVNASYYYILTPHEVASVPESSSVASEVATRFFGAGVASLLAFGLMISAYGTLHTTLLVGPRVPYAIARAELFPASLARVSGKGVPAIAVLSIGLWSIVLAASGTFDILTDMYIFVLWIFFGMNGIALFVLRRRFPDAERPYRTLGYPLVPLLFLCVTAFLLVNTLVATPSRGLVGVGLILLGLPIYQYFVKRAGPMAETDWLGADDR